MTERMIDADAASICTESFGELRQAPVLLVMGIGASMLWWEEGFCRMLVDHGRFVIRYDHRDTGRSTTYEPEKPGYTGAQLTLDAIAVLDGCSKTRATASTARTGRRSRTRLSS